MSTQSVYRCRADIIAIVAGGLVARCVATRPIEAARTAVASRSRIASLNAIERREPASLRGMSREMTSSSSARRTRANIVALVALVTAAASMSVKNVGQLSGYSTCTVLRHAQHLTDLNSLLCMTTAGAMVADGKSKSPCVGAWLFGVQQNSYHHETS